MKTITHSRLVADLEKLGLLKDDIVMVHASLYSVGTILGGPAAPGFHFADASCKQMIQYMH